MPTSTPHSPAVAAYLAAVHLLRDTFTAVKQQVPGPAATTPEARAALLATLNEVAPSLLAVCTRFSAAGLALTPDEAAEHKAHVQAQLHPLFLGSPFFSRAFSKPLGYAGDYGMVNQLLGDPLQGATLYDQLVNCVLLHADFPQGHRNRVAMLHRLLSEKATEAAAQGRRIRVLSIGCGPAAETQLFLATHPTPEVADIDLLDFNRETLDWTAARLSSIMEGTGKQANVRTIEESVYELAKRSPQSEVAEYDLVICAGLFDYLTDRFCKRVVAYCVAKTLPGGTTLVTNVRSTSDTHFVEVLMEWKLILRAEPEVEQLLPASPTLARRVYADETGTNIIGTVTRLA